MRGDLIETSKILNNFTDYGQGWFLRSERTGNLIIRQDFGNVNFFANRVVKYWNKLPETSKSSTSVNTFKNHLNCYCNSHFNIDSVGQYWELSYKIFECVGE